MYAAHLYINSAYDPFTYQYAHQRKDLPADPAWSSDAGETFLPWRLATSRALFLRSSRRSIPFESVTVGDLHHGNTDPDDPAYNSLADWIVRENVLELRIPWMLLGFSDPSSREVWNYPYKAGGLSFTHVSGIGVQPVLMSAGQPTGVPVHYAWPTWDEPTYHERLKQSYYVLQQAFARYDRPR